MGDGRAMQGDGEVTGTALETSLRGTFDVSVRKGQRLRWPRAETPTHYYVVSQLDKDSAVYRDARRRSPAARASHDTAAREAHARERAPVPSGAAAGWAAFTTGGRCVTVPPSGR